MSKKKKLYIYGLLLVNMFILSIFIILLHVYEYLILTGVFFVVFLLLLIKEVNDYMASDESKYEKQVNRIIKTYSPILVNTNTFPNLKEKSVLPIPQFDDLVNAQAEVRKPIYYVKGRDSTAFYLLNETVFLIYFVKLHEDQKSELEIEIDNIESSEVVTVDDPTPVENSTSENEVVNDVTASSQDAPVADPVIESSTTITDGSLPVINDGAPAIVENPNPTIVSNVQ